MMSVLEGIPEVVKMDGYAVLAAVESRKAIVYVRQ